MCGIFGMIREKEGKEPFDITEFGNNTKHRGPDFSHVVSIKGDTFKAVFGHHRLSIIDLSSSANQPVESPRYLMAFNGEIYNYLELASKLEKNIKYLSDTRVLLEHFETYGLSVTLNSLKGMYSIALLDKVENKMYLVRDKFGVKPLYYSFKNTLSFSSELKSFLSSQSELELSTESVAEYFRLGYVSGDRTALRDVNKVLPGNYVELNIDTFSVKTVQYFERENYVNEGIDCNFHDSLGKAFRYRTISDVPVAIFQSGGIDSSLISAILNNSNEKLNLISASFEGYPNDEFAAATKITSNMNVNLQKINITEDSFNEVIENIGFIIDDLFADPSIVPTTIICKEASEKGYKVVLSGDGADEFFGGYRRYRLIKWKIIFLIRLKIITRILLSIGVKIARLGSWKSTVLHRLYKGTFFTLQELYAQNVSLFNEMELEQLLSYKSETDLFKEIESLDDVIEWDIDNYLPNNILHKLDRASMINGIEAREPYLDEDLYFVARRNRIRKVGFLFTKIGLRRKALRYLRLKHVYRNKKGFGIPLKEWVLRDPLKYISFHLECDSPCWRWLNKKEVTDLINQNINDKNAEKVWRIYVFMKWTELWAKKK